MLSVLSVSPSNNQENVYKDASIEVEFSQEPHASTLTSANFRIYVMPGYTGQIGIKSITKAGTKVTIIPEFNYPEKTQILLWIRGKATGVASVISETMAADYNTVFTTGSKIASDDVVIEDTLVTSETLETIDPVDPEILTDDYLDVIGTFPKDGSANVQEVPSIVIMFDQDIAGLDMSEGISGLINPILKIEGQNYVFSNAVNIPEITPEDINILGNRLNIALEADELTINTEYTITLYKEHFSSTNNKPLYNDYTFTFGTKLFPMYNNSSIVRRRGGYLVPKSIDNNTIDLFIHDASIWVSGQLGKVYSENIDYRIAEATLYKTICDIANAISIGKKGFIKEETLADLKVAYDNAKASAAANDYCDKANTILLELLPDKKGAASGVKSGSTGNYPGSKRRINSYNNPYSR